MSHRAVSPARLLCLDKPRGPTSFELVRGVRRATGMRRVGHAGTLDPFASGLLVIGVGAATRLLGVLAEGSKTYYATVRFGEATDSGDDTGRVIEHGTPRFDRRRLESSLERFVGWIDQLPPLLSAIKVRGEPSYRRVRRGEVLEPLPARRVFVQGIEVLEFGRPDVVLRIQCGGGTYVRSLARDLGQSVGCPAHLACLRRERVGPFSLGDAIRPEQVGELWPDGHGVLRAGRLAADWPQFRLDSNQCRRIRQGTQPPPEWLAQTAWQRWPERLALLDGDGELVALARGQGADLRLQVVLPEEVDAGRREQR